MKVHACRDGELTTLSRRPAYGWGCGQKREVLKRQSRSKAASFLQIVKRTPRLTDHLNPSALSTGSLAGNSLVKLPEFWGGVSTIAKFANSKVPLHLFESVLNDCPPAPPRKCKTQVTRPVGASRRRRPCRPSERSVPRIEPGTDKFGNTVKCISLAKASLGWRPGDGTERVVGLALQIYVDSGCGGPRCEMSRLRRFQRITEYMCGVGHSEAKAGGTQRAPHPESITAIQAWLLRALADDRLKAFNLPGEMTTATGAVKQKKRTYVSRTFLAHLLSAIMIVRRQTGGHLPQNRFRPLLRAWGHGGSGTTISAGMALLAELGAIRCVNKFYRFNSARGTDDRARSFDVVTLWENQDHPVSALTSRGPVMTSTPPPTLFSSNYYWTAPAEGSPTDADLAALWAAIDDPEDSEDPPVCCVRPPQTPPRQLSDGP